MTQTGHRAARGLVAAVACVWWLAGLLYSQAPQATTTIQEPPTLQERIAVARRELDDLVLVFGGAGHRLSDLRASIPADNPMTDATLALGQKLFFDSVLSRDRSVSCATCHKPERAFADERPIAVGVFGRSGKRHSPSIVNRGFGRTQFWDGRAATLEELALQPLRDSNEMDLPPDEAILRLSADASYVAAFQEAFGAPPSTENMGRAIATFVRAIRSSNSPYDRFVAGDKTALTDEQQRGLEIFRRKARCVICHSEPKFTDEVFQNTGVAWRPNPDGAAGSYQDDGRFSVSGNTRDRGKFKTPTLREIARTAPYMHDGSLATLADVVEFYDKGGRPNPNLFQLVRPINLSTEEKQALVKFLEALSGEVTTTLPVETRPDFSGAWSAPRTAARGAATPRGPTWPASQVTLKHTGASLTVDYAGTAGTPVSLLYQFDAPEGQGAPRAAWRGAQLVLTSSESIRTADGASVTQETTEVLSLESPSTMTVQVIRRGA